jgi:hypothetical protein
VHFKKPGKCVYTIGKYPLNDGLQDIEHQGCPIVLDNTSNRFFTHRLIGKMDDNSSRSSFSQS